MDRDVLRVRGPRLAVTGAGKLLLGTERHAAYLRRYRSFSFGSDVPHE